MNQPIEISIVAKGPIGSGKTRAIEIMRRAIMQAVNDFDYIDGRYIDMGAQFGEEQRLTLRLK